MTAAWEIRQGDVIEHLREMADESVHCVVTSPPYYGLRDYGTDGQIGLEPTPDEYVARLVEVFGEVKRVLRGDGTLWLNLGDSYSGAPVGSFNGGGFKDKSAQTGGRDLSGHAQAGQTNKANLPGIKPKDLIGIPWMIAFALRADGWYLRSEIIWSKPNPMPESVTDRPTKAHEQVFLLSKSPRYYYDSEAIKEPSSAATVHDATGPARNGIPGQVDHAGSRGKQAAVHAHTVKGGDRWSGFNESGRGHTFERNKRSVWTVSTQPYPDAHFATFPPKLIEPMILAGAAPRACSECGAPWQRVTEREDQGYDGSRYAERVVTASGGAISGGTARSTLGSSNGKLTGRQQTTGWEPVCDHAAGGGHRELRPRYVVVENVAALLARGMGRVLGDLAACGYDAEWDCIPASAVGAPHRRDRLWLVAYPGSDELREQPGWLGGPSGAGPSLARVDGAQCDVADAARDLPAGTTPARAVGERAPASGQRSGAHPDADSRGCQGRAQRDGGQDGPGVQAPFGDDPDGLRDDVADAQRSRPQRGPGGSLAGPRGPRSVAPREHEGIGRQWLVEPDVGRVADGVPARVDRLRSLGNALVPQIAEWIGRRIIECEEETMRAAA